MTLSDMMGMPPDIMSMLGGGAPAPDPMAALMGGGPSPFPSIDPSALDMILGQIDAMQAQDIMNLQGQQQATLMELLMRRMQGAPNPAGAAAVASPGIAVPPPDAPIA